MEAFFAASTGGLAALRYKSRWHLATAIPSRRTLSFFIKRSGPALSAEVPKLFLRFDDGVPLAIMSRDILHF